MILEKHSNLGPPSLDLGGLRLWLREWHFPWEEGFWNGDWLVVTAHFRVPGADVRAEVRLSPDLACQEHMFRFQAGWEALEAFARGLRRHAEADPLAKRRKPMAAMVSLEG